jgi:ribosome-binding protein aMBF1 (putative translation factor)
MRNLGFVCCAPRLPNATTPHLNNRHNAKKNQIAAGSGKLPLSTDTVLALFGQNVRTTRLAAGWTQGDLAERTGLQQAYISQIETGAQNITLQTAQVVASALGSELWILLKSVRQQKQAARKPPRAPPDNAA